METNYHSDASQELQNWTTTSMHDVSWWIKTRRSGGSHIGKDDGTVVGQRGSTRVKGKANLQK